MFPVLRPDRVRALDERAIAGGTPSLTLMERAAGHLARAVLAAGGRGYGLRVALLCGKGNNGGDGIAAARHLERAGAAAAVVLVAGEDGLSDDAAVQLQRWRAAGGREAPIDRAVAEADVVVDCLLGTGASGAPRPPFDDAVEAIQGARRRGATVVACDLPTGVDADTGAVADLAVEADVTVSLGAHKRGLWLWPARQHCGRLVVGDIGLDVEGITSSAGDSTPTTDDLRTDAPAARVLEAEDIAEVVGPPDARAHKRTRGVVVVLAGSPGMSGAAALVARGAMAAGAGLVTVATSSLARHLIAPTIPEALTADLPDDDAEGAFEVLAGRLEGADALAVGPGLGHAEATVRLVRRLVAEVDVPLVLDADGLNAFRHDGPALAAHASPLLALTPHAGELARLLGPEAAPDHWERRVEVVPDRARSWNVTIVAKGPGSLIAAPDGRVWINPTGGPALATGGTGDVLTGMTATLVAQRPEPVSVAAAVWLHGLAGDLASGGAPTTDPAEPRRATRRARSTSPLDVAAAVPDALDLLP